MAKVFSLRAGSKVPDDVLAIAAREKIRTAQVTAIGGVSRAKIAYFDRGSRKYEEREFREQMEVTGLTGDLTLKDGKPFLHAHATFGRRDLSVLGGHVVSADVWPLLEVVIVPARNLARRRFDEGLGLYVIG